MQSTTAPRVRGALEVDALLALEKPDRWNSVACKPLLVTLADQGRAHPLLLKLLSCDVNVTVLHLDMSCQDPGSLGPEVAVTDVALVPHHPHVVDTHDGW